MGSAMTPVCNNCDIEENGQPCAHRCPTVRMGCTVMGYAARADLRNHKNGVCGCDIPKTVESYPDDYERQKEKAAREAQRQQVYQGRTYERAAPEGYEPLQVILNNVMRQASTGKGQERHADGRPWTSQPWHSTAQKVGPGFMLGQAIKKVEEQQGFNDPERQQEELLGAMHYIAMAIYYYMTQDDNYA